MEKRGLADILSEMLLPLAFVKKGSSWLSEGNEITKVVSLQKSRFSNRFYLNYGFILTSVPLDGLTMHVFRGLGSADPQENERIKELLDLDNRVSDVERTTGLRTQISDRVIALLQSVNTEEDLLNELKKRPHLNDVPLVVKKHFGLE